MLASIHSDQPSFDRALKNISASSAPHSLAPALSLALRTLGLYRLQSGADRPGSGVVPWALEQAFIVVLTNDATRLVRVSVHKYVYVYMLCACMFCANESVDHRFPRQYHSSIIIYVCI